MTGEPGQSSDSIFPRYSIPEDVERELESHLDFLTEELESQGWDRSAAREEALRRFGDMAAVARRCRAVARSQQRARRRAWIMDAVWQDLKYAVRTLMKNPGFAAVALLTLALGIGANTAVFSIIHGVLLKPLPYDRAEELVWVRELRQGGGTMDVAWPNYQDWKGEATSFSAITAVNGFQVTVLGGVEPVRAYAALVGEGFWSVFSAVPLHGRLTGTDDHRAGAAPVAVVKRSFWENQLRGRELDDLVLEILGVQVRVVGVVSDDLDYPAGADLWAPGEPFGPSESRTAHNWDVVGRLRPDAGLQAAREELDAITRRVVAGEADDSEFLAVGALAVPLVQEVVGDSASPLLLLLAAAGLVLLVACANLAGTILARGSTRDQELAVRASMGASSGRIARQLVTESAILGGFGGILGVFLAFGVVRGVRAAGPAFLPRVSELGLDGTALAFAAVTAVLTVVIFGLLPARNLSRINAAQVLRSATGGSARDGRTRVWRLLVRAEVAVALVLLVGSGLLVRSFQNLLARDPGFDPDDVVVAPLSLSLLKYETDADHVEFHSKLLDRIGNRPGVSSAGLLSAVPLSGSMPPNGRMELDGDLSNQTVGVYVVASGGAFEALDIPLLSGRTFDHRDGLDDEHVAVVSESFAEENWPGEDPIGKQVTGGGMDNFYQDRRFARVVGVVGDALFSDLGRDTYPTVYFPYTQRPFRVRYGARLVVESASSDAAALIPDIRSLVREADPEIPLSIRTLPSVVSRSLAERRFVMTLLTGFSFIALVLSAVGIFGVVSYVVALRTREMGIRMALGADPGKLLHSVMGGALSMVAGGVLVGLAGAVLVTRAMRSLLYQVTPLDPLAIMGAVFLLVSTAALAAWVPARSGTQVDPMITMRTE